MTFILGHFFLIDTPHLSSSMASCCFLVVFVLILFVGPGYNANYGSAEVGYAGNPYPANYGMNPVSFDIATCICV